jgi:drug/metabolite transporter (DMT)-like permease
MSSLNHKTLLVLAFLAVNLIWGTTYLAIVIGLEGFPPFLMASIRFIIAGSILVGFSFWKKAPFPKYQSMIKNSIIGMIVLVGGQGLLIWSEQYIESGYASVLTATLPIWFVILDRANWRYYFTTPAIIAGVVMGFGGILMLFRDKLTASIPAEEIQTQVFASFIVLLGAMCWVVGTLFNKSRPAPGSIYQNLGWQLLFGAVFSLLISLFFNETDTFVMTNVSWQAWAAVVYLAIAGSIAAYVAYTWLRTQQPAASVGIYAYGNPIVAVFLGWLLADEVISPNQIIGMFVIIGGALLINRNKKK